MANYCPNKLNKAKNFLFWNGTIRMFISNYLNLLLLSLLNLVQINDRSEYKDNDFKVLIASNVLSGIFFSHCIVVPIALSIYYYSNNHRIKDKDFNEKVGSFIEGTKR